jgi:Fe-S cluster assembly iron-binding protein IscA
MLHVTREARDQLFEMLRKAAPTDPSESQVGLRLVAEKDAPGAQTKFGLALDKPKKTDQVIQHGERNVLLVDSSLAEVLDRWTLAVVESGNGTQLSFRKAAESRC